MTGCASGTGACEYPTTQCAGPRCSGSWTEVLASNCLNGACPAGVTQSCGSYACESNACVTTCSTSADCQTYLVCGPTASCLDPWAAWPMPNPPSTGLPNAASYDTASTSGVVKDQVTGLWWQQTLGDNPSGQSWSAAGGYCAALALGGHNDWRVPTRIELVSLLDFTVAQGPMIETRRSAATCTSGSTTTSSSSPSPCRRGRSSPPRGSSFGSSAPSYPAREVSALKKRSLAQIRAGLDEADQLADRARPRRRVERRILGGGSRGEGGPRGPAKPRGPACEMRRGNQDVPSARPKE